MEELPNIKQEVYYSDTKPNVNSKTNVLDSVEIKLGYIKVEPQSYVPEYVLEPNNLDQKFISTEEAKMLGNNDKCMLDCSLLKILSNQNDSEIKLEGSVEMGDIKKIEDVVALKWEMKNDELNIKDEENISVESQGLVKILSKQNDSEIKLEGNVEMGDIEKIEDIVDVKWEIKNDELNIKDEENIKFESQGNSSLLVEQRREDAASSTNNKINADNFKCDHCDYKKTVKRNNRGLNLVQHDKSETVIKHKCDSCEFETVHKKSIKRYGVSFKHKKPKKVVVHKCDQCDYQTVKKRNLKQHSLKHNLDKFNWNKCDKCDFQTIYKHCMKRHILIHKNSEEVIMYKCDECGYQTIRKEGLKRHIRIHKNPDEVDTYKCDLCNYQTIYREYLKKHRSKHANLNEVNIYKCDQCDYQAVQKRYLRNHRFKHTIFNKVDANLKKVDLHKCNQCDYQTVQKRYLKAHILKHKNLDEDRLCINVINAITNQFINGI